MDIQLRNVSKFYGTQRAVDNIAFEVKTGEIVGFLGPNGAGKTTTMKMLTGYVSLDEGEILIGGRPMSAESPELKQHIGYLPEHNPLYEDMAVLDYLEFCGTLQGVPNNRIADRVQEMVRLTGLNREKHKNISELSKGYRQRVGLAQAMIHDPAILVLDEPTTGLDPNQIVEIRKLIRELGRHKTVILSTHILPEVEATCDRILIINKGQIVADGTAATLRSTSKAQEIVRLQLSGPANRDEAYKAIAELAAVASLDFDAEDSGKLVATTESGETLAKAVFDVCRSNNWFITEFTPLETKLEDIFRELTLSEQN